MLQRSSKAAVRDKSMRGTKCRLSDTCHFSHRKAGAREGGSRGEALLGGTGRVRLTPFGLFRTDVRHKVEKHTDRKTSATTVAEERGSTPKRHATDAGGGIRREVYERQPEEVVALTFSKAAPCRCLGKRRGALNSLRGRRPGARRGCGRIPAAELAAAVSPGGYPAGGRC